MPVDLLCQAEASSALSSPRIDGLWQMRYISELAIAVVGSRWGSSHLVGDRSPMERLSGCVCNAASLVGSGIACCIKLSY